MGKGKQMFFLLRTAFWVSVALALLPSFVPRQDGTVSADVTATDAVNAASATFADMIRLCERRPDACTAGSEFAVAFGQRTREGAKILYDLVGNRLAKSDHADTSAHPPGTPAPTTAAGDTEPAVASSAKPSQNTLTAADTAVPWHGPRPRRDTKHAT